MFELRKQQEAEFHNRREKDRLTLDLESFEKKYANKKWYSITRQSSGYVSSWMKRYCPGKTALDYCCGLGGMSLSMASNGAFVYGIDISAESVRTAERLLSDNGYGNSSLFQVMDAESLKFNDDTFDVIVCSGVLHHLDISRAFPELHRVLKPAGKIICIEALGYNPAINLYRKVTPNLRTAWEAKHIITMRQLELAKQYFGRIDMKFFHFFSVLAALTRKSVIFDTFLSATEFVDSILLRVPIVRLLAWQVVFELSQPRKTRTT